MKYIFSLVVCVLVTVIYCDGQQLSPQTINNAGQFRSAGSIHLEDALGGLIVNTIATGSFMYTQDFLQPDNGSTTIIPPINNVQLSGGWTLDNAGTTFINGNIMLEFTSGEVASITLNSASNLLTQGILQPYPPNSALPVLGLEFLAKRLNSNTVQLDWKTIQEINNKGFHIERKKENENNFVVIGFENAATLDGNSTMPLSYSSRDDNNYSGKTFYRLQQEDRDGRTAYSVVRIINGAESKQTVLQVWPVPSPGPVNILVTGISRPDKLFVYDMSGRLVQQLTVQNNTPIILNNLKAGGYTIRLAENNGLQQKIIIL